MFCRKCGAKIADDASFCTSCGARIEEHGVQTVVSTEVNHVDGSTSHSHSHAKSKSNNKFKVIAIILVIALVILAAIFWFLNQLTPEEEVLVKQVSEQIDEMGSITINSGATIESIEASYDALSAKCQRHVKNRKQLKQAKKEWNQLKADNTSKKISQIGEVTINSKNIIEAARNAYDKLTDEQVKLVDNYSTLESAENKFASVEVSDLISQIDSLDESIPINSSTMNALSNIQSTYEEMTPEQQNNVTNYDKLKSFLETYRAKSVKQCIEKINAIGDVSLESEELINSAAEAYSNVFISDRIDVSNYSTLKQAQSTLATLKNEEAEKAKTIVAGDSFDTSHWSVKLVKASLTSKILPNSTSGYYTYYYQTDGGIYLDLKFTIKNISTSIRATESILDSVKVFYGTQYTYTSYALFTSSGNSINKVYSWDGLDALKSTTLHIAVGLPEEALNSSESVKAILVMDGVEKIIKVR